jgi:hypothetical protein
VFGNAVEESGEVLFGVGRKFIAERHAQAVRASG